MTKIITNPLTGRMETVGERLGVDEDFAKKRLEQARRETRDFISGNVQFHQDDLGPSVADDKLPAWSEDLCKCGTWENSGRACDYCASDEYDPETV